MRRAPFRRRSTSYVTRVVRARAGCLEQHLVAGGRLLAVALDDEPAGRVVVGDRVAELLRLAADVRDDVERAADPQRPLVEAARLDQARIPFGRPAEVGDVGEGVLEGGGDDDRAAVAHASDGTRALLRRRRPAS